MTINLGGSQFTEAEVIAAIAASNDPPAQEEITPAQNLTEVNGILTSLVLRLADLEDRFPRTRAGFGVHANKQSSLLS